MNGVAMSETSQHGDNALLKAIRVGLANAHEAGVSDDHRCAVLIAEVLDAYGLVLPPGVTIGAVYEVFRGGMRDGYEFTNRREAEHQALFGGQDGRCGEVRTAWRIRADGVDVVSTWRPLDD